MLKLDVFALESTASLRWVVTSCLYAAFLVTWWLPMLNVANCD
jgi:hypothetical protein